MNKDIREAVEILKQSGTILHPADTVWGLGCDATNSKAVEKLYKLKQRNAENAALILVSDIFMIYEYVTAVPEAALELIANAANPLTVIFPGARGLAAGITGNDGSIGIRVVKNEFCKKLVKTMKRPLVSTSANISGQPAPKNFSEISDEIVRGADCAVKENFAEQMTGVPSSIVKINLSGEVEIIRN